MAEADGNGIAATENGSEPGSSTPETPAAADTTGARLRGAREAAGLSVKDLSAQTRITQRHVESLEAGDYAALPGRPYAIGFARSYARALGLDEKAIVDALRVELDQQAPVAPPREIHQFEVGDPAKTPTRLMTWLALFLVVAVAVMGGLFWRSYYWPSADLPALAVAEPTAAASAAADPAGPAAPAPAPAGPVVFTALDDSIWVKFYDGAGNQLMQKQMARGESWTLPAEAQDPKVWTGRPDALAITIGGQAVPRLDERQRIIKDVPVSAAALLARAAPQPAPVATQGPVQGQGQGHGARHGGSSPQAAPIGAEPTPAPAPAVAASATESTG